MYMIIACLKKYSCIGIIYSEEQKLPEHVELLWII